MHSCHLTEVHQRGQAAGHSQNPLVRKAKGNDMCRGGVEWGRHKQIQELFASVHWKPWADAIKV